MDTRNIDVLQNIQNEDDPEILYNERVKKYEEESKGMSALEKHVFLFLDKDKTFSPNTVIKQLKLMHASLPDIKGMVIASFNATHGSDNVICPAFSAQFTKDKNGFARFLHLGTTRIWKTDGTIDEVRMKEFKDFISAQQPDDAQKIVTLKTINKYLAVCLAKDPQETTNGNGRNAQKWHSSASLQASAATQGWAEVFDRLACGWTKDNEAYLTLEIAEEFMRDSPKAFLRAEYGLLPVPKPDPKQKAAPNSLFFTNPPSNKVPEVQQEFKNESLGLRKTG